MLDPFRGFSDMQSQVNRMFDQMLGNLAARRLGGRQLEGVTEWAPAIDITTPNAEDKLR